METADFLIILAIGLTIILGVVIAIAAVTIQNQEAEDNDNEIF